VLYVPVPKPFCGTVYECFNEMELAVIILGVHICMSIISNGHFAYKLAVVVTGKARVNAM
jgi:hypothetical protein